MLDGRIPEMDYGSSYGSGILKALQNENLPELDLLVREAIQNSSDAALGQEENFFAVNFNYGTFEPKKLNSIFEDISAILDDRFAGETADFLEIRDMMTSGLTGNVRKSEIDADDHGNYFKLVFDTGKEQTNSESGMAGGSWGYGKSVYYRVGIGLVIFYSRIKINEVYESRLVAAFVEDESDKNSILSKIKSNSIGRAWWGRKDPNNKSELLPITDEDEISEILDIFGVSLFPENQTGTAILIPYIDKKRLLDGVFPENCGISNDIIDMCSFKDDIVQYTELAIQKWYAPKIQNRNLNKYTNQKWLGARVNNVPIRFEDMRPFFQLIQELYTAALSANKHGKQEYHSSLFEGIRTVRIPSTKINGEIAGHVSTVMVKNSDINGGNSVIPPYAYLRVFNQLSTNDPITLYARAAGMVLDYKIDGKWTKGISKPEEDDMYLVSFLVPNCELKLKDDPKLGIYSGLSLGEYLKKCEKSDHMDWNDEASLTVVTNIARVTTQKINACYKKSSGDDSEGTTSRLSGKLGRRLLPTKNFGKKKGGSGGGSGSGGSGAASNNFELIINKQIIQEDSISFDFEMIFRNVRKDVFIGIFVETEVGVMDAKAWEEGIGTQFPISIPRMNSCSTYASNSGKTLSFDIDCTPDNARIENVFTVIEQVFTERGNTRGIRVHNEINNAIVKGTLVLKSSDKTNCCALKETKE